MTAELAIVLAGLVLFAALTLVVPDTDGITIYEHLTGVRFARPRHDGSQIPVPQDWEPRMWKQKTVALPVLDAYNQPVWTNAAYAPDDSYDPYVSPWWSNPARTRPAEA